MANDSGPVSGLKLFRHGERYMKTWPVDRRLSPVFPENRVINVTRFAMRLMPPLALFATGWQMVLGGQPGLTVATALFACSLPLQGLWWLGKRAVTPLPPALLHWYHEVRARLAESGAVIAPPEGRPDYQALAEVLRRAFRQPDKIFPDGF